VPVEPVQDEEITMRIAVLVLGLLLGVVMFLQTFLILALSDAVNAEDTAQAGAVGVVVALLWLVGCAFVIAFPLFSTTAFILAGVLGFAVSGDFPDMGVWGTISLVLAAMSFFGWRGKRKASRAKAAEALRQRERDNRLEALLAERVHGHQSGYGSIEVSGRSLPNAELAG
jgi:hypothetical protein